MSQPDVATLFKKKIVRIVQETLLEFRDKIKGLTNEMSANGYLHSGNHLKLRVKALKSCMQTLTDKCFEEVKFLKGQPDINRVFHAEFLYQQLTGFLKEAEYTVLSPPMDRTINAINESIAQIYQNLETDFNEFKAGLWRNRANTLAASVTNNTLNIQGSTVGAIQQAGEGSIQIAPVAFNPGEIKSALDDFLTTLNSQNIQESLKNDAEADANTIMIQINKTSPSGSIIREALNSLRNIVEGVAAGVLTIKFAAIARAVGIAIS